MQIKVIDMKISKKWQLNADGSQTSLQLLKFLTLLVLKLEARILILVVAIGKRMKIICQRRGDPQSLTLQPKKLQQNKSNTTNTPDMGETLKINR